MRFVTIRTANGTRAGRVEGDQVIELAASDVGALLAGGSAAMSAAATASGTSHALASVDLAPVIPNPPKIICVGQNYLAHILEMGSKPPEYPTFFAKYTRSLIGPRDDIVLPIVSNDIDWEVELAIVVGTPTRHISKANAFDAIAGWTILNDVSVRDYQRRTSQFLQGKTFESTTPLGPALVTKDEVDVTDVALSCEVDGQVMQNSRTSDLLFKIDELVSYISDIMTLDPGDVIATGTPSGVGAGRNPQVFLKEGQTVVTRVAGLGELVNRCVRESR